MPFHNKIQQSRNKRKLPNIIKAKYEKPTLNFRLSGERLKVFPQRNKTKRIAFTIAI